eukprot:8108099-Prorocentrum_lima.AAC.1
MTSSLVGSEMCIRDSPCCRVRRRAGALLLPAYAPSGTRRGPRQLGESVPVSYTHLTLPTICSV